MRIKYNRRALVQLGSILDYIDEHSPQGALKVKRAIIGAINRLSRFPYSCRKTEHPGIRLLTIPRYRYLVFYTIDETAQEIHVLRIRHSSQDPASHLD